MEQNKKIKFVWKNMKQRCYNKNHKSYHNYGGRGIEICDEWKNNFSKFHKWAIDNGYNPNAPRGECTIDRINVNGNYEPSNCRWISNIEQQQNKRNNNLVTYKGETKTVTQWEKEINISRRTICRRLKEGLDIGQIIEKYNKVS